MLLVLGFIDLLTQPGYGAGDLVVLFVRELGVGLLAGVVLGWVGVQVLRRVALGTDGLYPVASLAVRRLRTARPTRCADRASSACTWRGS